MPDADAAARAGTYLEKCIKSQDSAGGVVECRITGVPAGLGSPVFEKLDAVLAQAVMSVGAVKAVEIGDGTEVAHMNGSDDNDGFHFENGQISKTSNHAGGIMGGISDGSEIILRAYIKPLPLASHRKQLHATAKIFLLKFMDVTIQSSYQGQLSLLNLCVRLQLQMHFLPI